MATFDPKNRPQGKLQRGRRSMAAVTATESALDRIENTLLQRGRRSMAAVTA